MQIKGFIIIGLALLLGVSSFGQPPSTYPTRRTVSGAAKKAYEKGMAFNVAGENLNAIR